MKNESERQIERLELHILEMTAAVKQAHRQALSSGSSVLVSDNGAINEVFPDGTVRFVKQIPLPIKMEKGKIIEIK